MSSVRSRSQGERPCESIYCPLRSWRRCSGLRCRRLPSAGRSSRIRRMFLRLRCTATRRTARRRPTPSQTEATPAFIDSINADPDVALVAARRRHPLGQAVLHPGLRPADLRPVDARSAIRSSTRPATTSGPTATRRPRAAAPTTRRPARSTTCSTPTATRSTTPSGDPVANLELVRSIFFPQPGRHARRSAASCVLSQAQAYDRAHPTDAEFVENVMWEQSGVVFVDHQRARAARTTTPTSGTARRPRAPRRRRRSPSAPAPTCAGSTPRSRAPRLDGVKGVVIMAQADMWDPEKGAAHQAGYEPFVRERRVAHDRASASRC